MEQKTKVVISFGDEKRDMRQLSNWFALVSKLGGSVSNTEDPNIVEVLCPFNKVDSIVQSVAEFPGVTAAKETKEQDDKLEDEVDAAEDEPEPEPGADAAEDEPELEADAAEDEPEPGADAAEDEPKPDADDAVDALLSVKSQRGASCSNTNPEP